MCVYLCVYDTVCNTNDRRSFYIFLTCVHKMLPILLCFILFEFCIHFMCVYVCVCVSAWYSLLFLHTYLCLVFIIYFSIFDLLLLCYDCMEFFVFWSIWQNCKCTVVFFWVFVRWPGQDFFSWLMLFTCVITFEPTKNRLSWNNFLCFFINFC